MIGVGLQPAGLTDAGTGAADAAGAPPLAGQGAPWIGSNGNYVIDPVTLDIGRTTSTRHRVMLALQTELGTATADTDLGERKPTKIGSSTATDAQDSIRRALQPLVDDGSISLDEVGVKILGHAPGAVSRTINYTDLLNLAADKANR